MEINQDEIKKVKKTGHRYKPGHPGGPGRPKGSLSASTLLQQALDAVEKDQKTCKCQDQGLPVCKTIREHFAKRAFHDDKVLVAFMKKIEPDLIQDTGSRPPTQINIIYGHLKEADQPKVQIFEPTNRHTPASTRLA